MKKIAKRTFWLVAVLFVAVIIIMPIIMYNAYTEAFSRIKDQINERQLLVGRQTSIGIETNLQTVVEELERLSRNPAMTALKLDETREAMERAFEDMEHHYVNDIAFLDSKGIVRVPLKAPHLTGKDFSFRKYFKEARTMKKAAPAYEFIDFRGVDIGQKGIVIAMPVFREKTKFAGVVLFTIKVKDLIEGFVFSGKQKSEIWVVDGNLNVLFHPIIKAGTHMGDIPHLDVSFSNFLQEAKKGEPLKLEYVSPSGVLTVAASHPLRVAGQNWSVIVSTDEEAVKSLLTRFTKSYVLGTVSTIFVIILGAFIFIYLINRWNLELKHEVTKHEKTEALLAKSEELFRGVFKLASDCILLLDPAHEGGAVIVDANLAACEMYGYTKDELIGNPVNFLDDPECRRQAPDRILNLFSGKPQTFELMHVRKDGSSFPVETSALMINIGLKRYILTINRNITGRKRTEAERKAAHGQLERLVEERTAELLKANKQLQMEISEHELTEKKLIKQNEFVQSALEALTHPFYVIDAKSRVIKMANSASNFGPLDGSSFCYKLTHNRDKPCEGGDHPCTITEIMKTREPVMLEHVHYDKDGKALTYEVHGFPIFNEKGDIVEVIEYNLDITERRRLEQERLRASNLQLTGQLAAGVAHEINNPLANATLNMHILKTKLGSGVTEQYMAGKIDIIGKNIERAAAIASELLQFSRHKEAESVPFNVNEAVSGALLLLKYRLSGITVERDLSDVPDINCDPMKIEQVIINVLSNSIEAMNGEGRVHISTAPVNGEVMISITDNGPGIPEENLQKVFEPFFTTKEAGEGTGLGLSISYSIISQHKGTMEITDTSPKGATVTIRLPATGRPGAHNAEGEA